MRPALSDIRACFEGVIPGVMATCGADGMPNVAYLSQVYYVDVRHVALSFQFFNKTRQNILVNPNATVLVLDPRTGQFFRLAVRYLRTETTGALFERMKAQLAGIASHTGMAGVFRLRGADVYEVHAIEALDGELLPAPAPRCDLIGAVRRCSEKLAQCVALDELLDTALSALTEFLGVRHALVLLMDPAAQRLYTVASCGYANSGVGSEIELGDGVIGVAAREATPVRIGHMSNAYLYGSAVRQSLHSEQPSLELQTVIPYPGLAEPCSQLAVPIISAGRVLGVLFVESPEDVAFGYEDEDMLVVIAGHLGSAMALMQAADEHAEAPGPTLAPPPARGAKLSLRRYHVNDSIFVDDAYLIKGVAGAILWKLLRDFTLQGRTEFTNRELRLDPSIPLPDVADNLEARLVLLQRRLQESSSGIRIEKTGRGRFRLVTARPVTLHEVMA